MAASEPPYIRYATTASQLYIGFAGQATHRSSLTAERLVSAFLAANPPQPTAILDLTGCAWADSTFAGWMLKLRQRLARTAGRVVVSRCPEACRSSLVTMGLASLFDFEDVAPPTELTELPCPEIGADASTIAFMLEAHQRLADLSPENQRLFADIAQQLQRELDKRI